MNSKLNFLLRTALSAATDDREAFVEKFSALLEKYTGIDKETGQSAGRHLSGGLAALRNELENAATRQEAGQQSSAELNDILARLESIQERLDEIEQTVKHQKA